VSGNGREAGVTPRRSAGSSRRRLLLRWLRPGVGIKRWLVAVFLGELLLALAGALVIRQIYRDVPPDAPAATILDLLSLQFLPFGLRPLVLLGAGLLIFLYGSWRLINALIEPFREREEPLVEMLYQRRWRARGPRIVAIGGGTGLSMLLRGLKELTSNITAVVTVADDGGSSGKLREELGVPPVGDIRNCIAALADAEPAMTRLMQYRFPANGTGKSSFEGHAFGNLLIAALADVEGDFEEGVRQSNRVLAVRGKVVPVAAEPMTLHAELSDGTLVRGQSRIARARGIAQIWVTPEDVSASRDALAALADADLVVIGPGSLYTSIMPSLLVSELRAALEATPAPRLYVCNVATQVGETEGFNLSDHLTALHDHGLDHLVDAVLANDNLRARAPSNYPAAPVEIDVPHDGTPPVLARDVVDDENAHHHDSHKLAQAIVEIFERRLVNRAITPRSAAARVAVTPGNR
jgi:uncharacterized cofD-like protein